MMYRLPAADDEWIERSSPLSFTFEGVECHGFAGDTISSALAGAGLPYVARSFKYHRPRGLLSFANHDSNALFQVDGVANVRGDVTPLREGMRVAAVNTFGGLRHDTARVLDHFARFLPVGFYYKAFYTKRLFPRWERMFRSLTGLGRVDLLAKRTATAKRYGFCDVLVIGGGPSGLAAALAATAAGARVALVEEACRLGGSGGGETLTQAIEASPRITVYTSTVASGCYADRWVALAERDRMTKMRAGAIVFATGVIEQPAVFRNNDLPGVMLASGALRLVKRHRVSPGRRVVMIAGNLDAYTASVDLKTRGVNITTIVELRAAADADGCVSRCKELGIEVLQAHAPYQAVKRADGGIRGLDVAPFLGHAPLDPKSVRRIVCDAIVMSVGWAGAAQLMLQAGGAMRYCGELQQFIPRDLPPGLFAAGRVNGVYETRARIADGERAGSQAAAYAGFGVATTASIASTTSIARTARTPSHPFAIVDHPRAKNFVDFDEDLQVKDLENAIQEGFDSSELLKRYSTVGMGPSQGKHSNMNALRVLARARGLELASLALTTARPMYHPVPLKLLAGRSFYPERRTPLDAIHQAIGAVWMPAGNWRRPEYYAAPGENRAQSIEAEVLAVRTAVGLIDVGTLGKIEIYGPDAGSFLDRVYAGSFSNLKVGMTRYGLMLDESGVIVDDGVVARLSEESFYFTTTTGGSAAIFRELLRLNALWGLDCSLMNLTGHRAAMNFAGPLSRDILRRLTDVDLSEAAFPYLAVRSGSVAGVAARLLRVGFVGELGYEIHVPASGAALVWEALGRAGRSRGLRPFGVEAQRVLRLEKGHFIVGQDTDGLTDPDEANAGWAVAKNKSFFIGQRSLRILRSRGPRQMLVGFELNTPAPMPKECHLIIEEGEIVGRVTSITHSKMLEKSLGLAMVSPRLAQIGREIRIRIENGEVLAARIAATPFYDPHNALQRTQVSA